MKQPKGNSGRAFLGKRLKTRLVFTAGVVLLFWSLLLTAAILWHFDHVVRARLLLESEGLEPLWHKVETWENSKISEVLSDYCSRRRHWLVSLRILNEHGDVLFAWGLNKNLLPSLRGVQERKTRELRFATFWPGHFSWHYLYYQPLLWGPDVRTRMYAWFDLTRLFTVQLAPLLGALWLVSLFTGITLAWLFARQEDLIRDELAELKKTVERILSGETDLKFRQRRLLFTQQVSDMLEALFAYFTRNVQAREIEHQRDPLTGLYTRRFLMENMEGEIKRCKRFIRPMSFIMADLDHFKNINDTYGHLTGDKVLSAVGQILKSNTRETDRVARYGGEEIAIVLSETSLKDAYLVAEKLRRLVEQTAIETDARALKVTLSLGVTSFLGGNEDTVEAIIQRADQALYEAKQSGRNQVRKKI